MNLEYDKEKLNKICEEKGISSLMLFGSYARGDNNSQSDIDLLVKYKMPVGLLSHANVQNALADLFMKPVDLVFESNIKPRIRPYIINDLVTLYAER